MPPKVAPAVKAARDEAEERAILAFLSAELAAQERPVCLPRLPLKGRTDIPELCRGEWGDRMLDGILDAVNTVREEEGRMPPNRDSF